MNIGDITSKNDLKHFTHYKKGDLLRTDFCPEGDEISDIVYVDDPKAGRAIVFFHVTGEVGSVIL